MRLRPLRVFQDNEGVIVPRHRVVHRNQSISLRDDDRISSQQSKILVEPSVYQQNASRSSWKQSVSLDDESVSVEKHRVVGDQEEKDLVEQTVVLIELRVSLTKDRVILADEPVGLANQEIPSRSLRVGPPGEVGSPWLVAFCNPVLPSSLG
jgi:hypothetical protein